MSRTSLAVLLPLHRLDSQPLAASPEEAQADVYHDRFNQPRGVGSKPANLPSEASALQAGPVTYRVSLTPFSAPWLAMVTGAG